MICNVGHDERGKYSGGVAGDQKADECAIIPWYNRPWSVVIRPTSDKIRNLIAELATELANNNKIGYDQDASATNDAGRYSFWEQVKKVGYHPKNITKACETDCSNSTAVIVKCVGYLLGIKQLQDVSVYCYTGNIESALVKTGYFKSLKDSKYLTSDKYLMPGDLLLYTGHHIAINLTAGSCAATTYYESKVTSDSKGLKVVASDLNVRKEPVDGAIVKSYKCGSRIFVIGKTYINNALWFHTCDGWISGKYVEGWYQEESGRWKYIYRDTVCGTNAFKNNGCFKIDGLMYAFDEGGELITADRITTNGDFK